MTLVALRLRGAISRLRSTFLHTTAIQTPPRLLAGRNTPVPVPRQPPTSQSPRFRTSPDGYVHFASRGGSDAGGAGGGPSWLPHSPILRAILALSVGGGAVYLQSVSERAPFTGRFRLLGMSRGRERDVGRRAYDQLLSRYGPRILPVEDMRTQRVRRIVARLAGAAVALDAKLVDGFEWMVVVADDDAEVNAMCVPGGRMLITTGLLELLQTDDRIAVVLGHEMAHAVQRHGAEQMFFHTLITPLLFLVDRIFDLRWLPTMVATIVLSLPFSRKLEHEADYVGLLLTAEACFNPSVAPDVFLRLAKAGNERPAQSFADRMRPYISTHPESSERSERMRSQLVTRAERYRDKCGVHGFAQQFDQFR